QPVDQTNTLPADTTPNDRLTLPTSNQESLRRGEMLTETPGSNAAPLFAPPGGETGLPSDVPNPLAIERPATAGLPTRHASQPRTVDNPTINHPAGAAPVADNTTAKASTKRELLASRLALAVGDVRTARNHLENAKSYNAEFTLNEDSPAKVEAAVRKYEDIDHRREGRQQKEAWKRLYSEALLDQALGLLTYGQFDEADRLATDAQQLGVSYASFETSPRTVLDRIAEARQNQATTPGTGDAPRSARSSMLAQDSNATPPPAATNTVSDKDKALALTRAARQAMAQGKLDQAEQLVRSAVDLDVKDSLFAPGEDRPHMAALDLYKARAAQGVVQAAGVADVETPRASRAVYHEEEDVTFNAQATAVSPAVEPSITPSSFGEDLEEPAPLGPETSQPPAAASETPAEPEESTFSRGPAGEGLGMQFFQQGTEALRARNRAEALRFFQEAYRYRSDLDPGTLQRLQDHLQMLSVTPEPNPLDVRNSSSLLDSAAARQQLLARQLSADITREQGEVRRLRVKQPKQALERLQKLAQKVEESGLDPEPRGQLLTRVELSIKELEKYIDLNRAQIELDENNRAVLDDIERRRSNRLEIQEKLAEMVDQFNRYRDTGEYEKMEVVAKRARELAPEDPIVRQMFLNARAIVRIVNDQNLQDRKEQQVFQALHNVDAMAGEHFDDNNPFVYDLRHWDDIKDRSERYGNADFRKTPRELEIEQKLRHPVTLQFQEAPLGEVMDYLGKYTGINIHLDPRGMAEEGVTSSTPVSIQISNEVMLKSALNLILQPLHLSYVVKDEVLKITSEQLRDGETYTRTYNVADLVIPIPNFVPGSHLGLQGALNDSYAAMGVGQPANMPAVAMLASQDGAGGAGVINPELLAQMPGSGMPGPRTAAGPAPGGPGGLGGGAQADFDSLIELITATTIAPQTWDEVGGAGAVDGFEGGVYVDAAGLMRKLPQRPSAQLAALHEAAARRGTGHDWRVRSEFRKISLPRLERAVMREYAAGRPLDETFQLLAGLNRVTHILVYPETGDVVIAGPAGDYRFDNEGRTVSVDSGRPLVRLDDLVVTFRNALTDQSRFGCSITPRQQQLAATKTYLQETGKQPLKPGGRDRWLNGLRDTLGRQDITVYGIDPQTRAGRIMIEADYRMKLIGIGIEQPAVKINSYVDRANPRDISRNA
ncbi:MAG: DUF1598 domain-containing protein, partial [Planctomycetales bacterium]|nr:DUF1598 domain-containing protein [Planctomycetales bacterium]